MTGVAGPSSPPPARAAVSPRVHVAGGGAAQPLDRLINELLAKHAHGAVLLTGTAGGGKTTALAHLRAVLSPDAPVAFLDEPSAEAIPTFRDSLGLVASRQELAGNWFLRLELVPWILDDWIEYCSARRRDTCAAVLWRLSTDPNKSLLKGNPQLWRVALDRMAADEELPTAVAALREHIDGVFPRGKPRDAAAVMCAYALVDEKQPLRHSQLPGELSDYARKLLRHRAVRVILAADFLGQNIAAGATGVLQDFAANPLPHELMHETAAVVRAEPSSKQRLEGMLNSSRRATDALAASLLLAADANWRPGDGRGLKLIRAHLPHAKWAAVELRGADLMFANFSGADLAAANLRRANVSGASFSGCKLAAANLHQLKAHGADFSDADLQRVAATGVDFSDADLTGADLRDADLSMSKLFRASFKSAVLNNADLEKAELCRNDFEDAELIGVNFDGAKLENVRLCAAANVSAVSFHGAKLLKCELDGLRLAGCDFRSADLTGSYLTGSFIPRGDFQNAILRDTGLAESDWEEADLRNADLRGATFHMGSSRSGLVGSIIPCEGSKTGFYTDDYLDQDFKAPEEIRKANLRGADLRGANVEDVDFYLVDLRDVKCSDEQRVHFARCGAILSK